MAATWVAVYSNYSNGYIVEFAPVDASGDFTDEYCRSWMLLPAENLWPKALRGFLYIVGIIYIFIGVAIGSDVFMTSIEVITSRKRTVVYWDEERGQNVKKEVLVWNETVANLTLLALGSSAPEILLATVEAITGLVNGDDGSSSSLGFYTIVGSAAFNLLVITAICIVSVPSPGYKRINDLGVFMLTSIVSLLAYVWLLCVLLWVTPNVVDWWEAWLTLCFFPLLVLAAYAQDNKWWCRATSSGAGVVGANGGQPGADSGTNGELPREPDMLPAVINGVLSHSLMGKGTDIQRTESRNQIPDSRNHVQFGGAEVMQTPQDKRAHRSKATVAPITPGQSIVTSNPPPPPTGRRASQQPEPVYKPFARARFRHAAIRSLGASKRLLGAQLVSAASNKEDEIELETSDPKMLSVVSKVTNSSGRVIIPDSCSGTVSFASPTHAVLESAGTIAIDVLLHRRKRARQAALVATTDRDGKFDTKLISGAITVEYETREGSAKMDKDFKFTSGVLVFGQDEFAKKIEVPIINDNQYFPDTDFYVILRNPSGDAILGDPSISRVTIIDDDKPGNFAFMASQIYADMKRGEVVATVIREGGCDGEVSVYYATIDGTAKGGDDFEDPQTDFIHTSDKLVFKDNETSKLIKVPINQAAKGIRNFVLCLRNPSVGSNIGDYSAAVANLNIKQGDITAQSRVLVEDTDMSWAEQLRRALTLEGDLDDEGKEIPPSATAFVLHFLAIPWKLLFALGPPQHACGGYPAFVVSILSIGFCTALIEQLGHLLGCVAGLRTLVTGITLIALGTSLPDTLASRTAALQDSFADASIGNITGSNCVNVFLGLGLPWVIRTMYFAAVGGEYRVNTDGLEFAVTIFDAFGTVCVIVLLTRRFALGGELGGTMLTKWLSASLLLVLWLTFILVASLKAYDYF